MQFARIIFDILIQKEIIALVFFDRYLIIKEKYKHNENILNDFKHV